jgi:23S rRNA (cytosine1962-C5)-methyltransferase
MDLAKQAEMLANRVRKTQRQLHGKFEQQGIGAYRLYDRDIPEIRAVIDWYEGHLVMAEYTRTQTLAVEDWLGTMARAVAAALEVPMEKVHLKQRRTRPAEGARYERLAAKEQRLEVRERGLRFLCNLDDFIDTGLFADHRETRALVRAESRGARVLNLFGYTGSFTCAAAAGGALATTTVDLSQNYLRWAQDNLELNKLFDKKHDLLRADAREFLESTDRTYSLIVCDPPTFSDGFDVGRDHRALVEQCLALLDPGGVLWFSTNHQRFEPNLPAAAVEMTAKTVPPDYRNRAVHRSFRITK